MEAQKDVGIPLSRIRLNALINLMLATTAEAAAQFRGEERQELESLAAELLHCRRVPDVWEAAQRLFRFLAMAESPDEGQRRSCEELLEAAKRYIGEHYSDVNLSVTMTADQVGISASYLTQLFKKYCGHSTADYIHMTRLSHAKSLLDQHRIKEVAEQVGYQDVRSLIRVFKKYEGKTPSRFRDAERPIQEDEPQ